MFGYVTVNPDELSEAEKARFREIYCGVCVSLKRRGGARNRMTLSYDAAFLALLLNALYEPEEEKGLLRCAAHPAKKQAFAVSEMTGYAADMNVLLFYYRALDNWQDDHSRVAQAVSKAFARRAQAVAEKYPEKARAIQECLSTLAALERERSADTDATAGCFGRLLGEIYAVREDEWAQGLGRMGCALGRFIYLLDAWDDAEKDEKSGSFNPLLPIRAEPDYETRVYSFLTMEIAACAMEFEKLPIVDDAHLIRNVLYSGVWTRYSRKKEAQERKEKGSNA